MVNNNEFVQLVAKMREAQKSFFRCHTSIDLQRSKQLEKQVDAELAQYTMQNGHAVKQPSLFDEQPQQQQPKQQTAKMKHPVLGLRCCHCNAVYQLHALAYPIDGYDAKQIAMHVQSGDIPFICEASEVKLEKCTCTPQP